MASLQDLLPGDLMFTTIDGIPGKAISLAEKVNDPVVTWDEAKRVQHVGVVTAAGISRAASVFGNAADMNRMASILERMPPFANPRLVQAMPGGAQDVALTEDYWTSAFIYVRPRYAYLNQNEDVAKAARRYIGVPYSFLDYVAIAGRHALSLKPTSRTVFDRYVSSTKHMICSQLADQALADAGFHVFDDGRIPQDVTPAALYHALVSMPGTQIVYP